MSMEKDWGVVKYHKDFAMVSWKDLNAFEQDILAILLVAMRNRKENIISLPIRKMEEVSGKRFRKYLLKEQTASMREKLTSIHANFATEDYEGTLVIFPTIAVSKDLNTISIRINPDYQYLLNDFDFKYLKWNLSEHIALPTAYSKSLYRYLSSFLDTGFWHIEIAEFRKLMNVPKSYDTNRLMDKVVNPAIETIKKTIPDKFESLQVIKVRGTDKRTVTALRFEFDIPTLEMTDSEWDTKSQSDGWEDDIDEEIPF